MQIRQTVPLAIFGALVVTIGVVLLTDNESSRPENPSPHTVPQEGAEQGSKPTLGARWDKKQLAEALHEAEKQRVSNTPVDQAQTSFGMSVLEIYQAIGEIEIDGEGLVVDQRAKYLLENAVDQLGPHLTESDLAEIDALLVESLPEPYGAKAGDILRDFYQFKLAEQQQARTHPPELSDEAQFDNLVSLRREHLGDEVANKLYGNEEALHRFLVASQSVRANDSLNADQKSEKINSLKRDLSSGYLHIDGADNKSIDGLKNDIENLSRQGASEAFIDQVYSQSVTLIAAQQAIHDPIQQRDFQNRVNQFNREREFILKAGLVESDKIAQLKALAQKYFTDEELAKAEYYQPQN